MALSRERIADELLKLLALPDPAATVTVMVREDVLRPVLPEIAPTALPRLHRLVEAERQAGVPPHGLRRLSALLPPEPLLAEKVAVRLKSSNKARKRLTIAADQDLNGSPHALAYWVGPEGATDRLLLAGRVEDATSVAGWLPPKLPIAGGALIKRGLAPGPAVARTLQAVERRWVAEGFPDGERFETIVAEALAGTS